MAQQQEKTVPAPVDYVDEPHRAREYAEMLSRAAMDCRPVVVRRRGVAYAAVISLEHLRTLQDALALQEAEELAAQIDWSRLAETPPAPEWLEGDEPKPF